MRIVFHKLWGSLENNIYNEDFRSDECGLFRIQARYPRGRDQGMETFILFQEHE